MKKFLVVLLALAMVISSAAALEISEPGKLPLVSEPTELTMMLPKSPLVTDYNDNYLTKLIAQETGVTLKISTLPTDGSEAKQKFSLMVAGGEKLPDIIQIGLSGAEVLTYGAQGYLVPLNEYLEKDGYFWNLSMDTWCTEEEKANVLKYAALADGNIYGMPAYYCDPGDATALGMWINKKWCENLGLEIPTTTDELYTVLKAFKEQDANGNGDPNDEIPLIGHNGWMGNVCQYIMNSFVYDAYTNDFGCQLDVKDGKLFAPFATDEWREGLRYLNKLSDEGLLSPLSFSQGQTELRSILCAPNTDPTLVGAFVGHPSPLFGSDGSVDRVQEYTACPAMIGPNGVQWSPFAGQFAQSTVYITCDCENPELAFRVLDTLCREDLSLTVRYGEQGVDWEYTTEGEVKHKYLPGYSPIYGQKADGRTPWTAENNIIWNVNTFGCLPPKLFAGLAGEPYPEGNRRYQMDTLWYSSVPLRYDRHPSEMCLRLIMTEEETDDVAEIQSNLQEYVNEAVSNFVLGNKSVEKDWDSYLAELETIGLSHYMEVAQTIYDRMSAE